MPAQSAYIKLKSKCLRDQWIVEDPNRGKAMWRTVRSFVDAGLGDVRAALKDIKVVRYYESETRRKTSI